MAHICLVEDENSIGSMVKLNLEMEGYAVQWIKSGGEAKLLFSDKMNFDLIILDVMLPEVNGIELGKIIRDKSSTPILFLSAKGTTKDRIEGLKAGGNDYLPKPFDLEELLLRVKVLLGNQNHKKTTIFELGEHIIDFNTYEVEHKKTKQKTALSKREIELLKLFIEHNGEVLSRVDILEKVWGENAYPTTRTIDNYILNFRKLFEKDPKNPCFFHSIRGVGYKFTLNQ